MDEFVPFLQSLRQVPSVASIPAPAVITPMPTPNCAAVIPRRGTASPPVRNATAPIATPTNTATAMPASIFHPVA